MNLRNLLWLWCISCFPVMTYAQNHTFTLGPAVGIDQFLSSPQPVNGPNVDKNTAIHYKAGLLYGIEASYSLNKIMLNARMLTTRRVYDVTSDYQSNPLFPVRVTVKAQYYSLPITVSYQLKTNNRLQLLAGVGVVPEWIDGAFNRTSYDILGSGIAIQLDPENPARRFSLGGSLQLVGRYHINEHFLLQMQPALHYFQTMSTPFANTNNSSFSVSFSIGYKLNR